MATEFNAAAQQVLFAALDGNVSITLNGETVGFDVYDEVPFEPEGAPDNAFPYITVGDTDAIPFDNDTDRGVYMDADLHVWSRFDGRKEARDGMDVIYGLLHRATLSLAGYKFVDCLFQFSDILKEGEDGKTKHGIIRFRLTIQEA